MSRASLRRQMFHKNLDRLLTEKTLHPVQEEHQNNNMDTAEPITDLDYIDEESRHTYSPHPAAEEGRSPIYKPKPDWRTSTKKIPAPLACPLSAYENSYAEPWSPICVSSTPGPEVVEDKQHHKKFDPISLSEKHATRPVSEYENSYAEPWSPSTPGPESTGDKPHYKKKTQPVQPLKFQFPDLNNNELSMSPIHKGTALTSRPTGNSRTSVCDPDIRSLPMSPALFLTQATSTPGAREEDFQDPRCKTIREHSYPECNMCRICHEDGSKEKLVSPCHCAGTMGMLHMSCLERWLGSSNTTKCEICQFQFKVLKKRHPIKWYMQEPSLHEDRRDMTKDIVLTLCVSLLVIITSILCLSFAGKLLEEDKEAPCVILILVAIFAMVAYCIWVAIVARRMYRRCTQWNKNHHIIQIRQSIKHGPKNKIFRRFSLGMNRKAKSTASVDRDLQSSTYISYSLESYKAAMFNPVNPTQPLLDNMHDLTSLEHNSPSVISLDDDTTETTVIYYQPPESGQTSVLYSETGKLLKETGV